MNNAVAQRQESAPIAQAGESATILQVMPSPRYAARLDWAQIGEFRPEQFEGDERKEYEDEAAKIERQWDNQER